MNKPKKQTTKYRMVKEANPNYYNQLVQYRDWLSREAAYLARKLANTRAKLTKANHELEAK